MRIGVTGAAGFIGRHVLTALGTEGHEAVPLVRASFDVTRAREQMAAIVGLDALIHVAAHVPRNYRDPDEARACNEVNALGTLEVLRACRDAGVKKVVHLSGNIYRLGTEPASEDAAIEPSSSAPYYLASKATADFYAGHFDRVEGLPTTILRPSAVYGPGLARGMIVTFATRLAAREPVTIADGARYRADLVYVEDVAKACVAAATREARGAFNIGAGATVSALQIAEVLADLLGTPHALITVEPAQGDAPIGFPPLDITRARRELGYAPRDLRAGLAAYLAARSAP